MWYVKDKHIFSYCGKWETFFSCKRFNIFIGRYKKKRRKMKEIKNLPLHKWMYRSLPRDAHTYQVEKVRIFLATKHHLQLMLLYGGEIHTHEPIEYDDFHVWFVTSQYRQQLVPLNLKKRKKFSKIAFAIKINFLV